MWYCVVLCGIVRYCVVLCSVLCGTESMSPCASYQYKKSECMPVVTIGKKLLKTSFSKRHTYIIVSHLY